MEQEAAYIEALKNTEHYQIRDDILAIKNEAGEIIVIFHRNLRYLHDIEIHVLYFGYWTRF